MTKSIIVTHIYADSAIKLTSSLIKVVAERTLKVIVSLSIFLGLIISFNVFANTPKNE